MREENGTKARALGCRPPGRAQWHSLAWHHQLKMGQSWPLCILIWPNVNKVNALEKNYKAPLITVGNEGWLHAQMKQHWLKHRFTADCWTAGKAVGQQQGEPMPRKSLQKEGKPPAKTPQLFLCMLYCSCIAVRNPRGIDCKTPAAGGCITAQDLWPCQPWASLRGHKAASLLRDGSPW